MFAEELIGGLFIAQIKARGANPQKPFDTYEWLAEKARFGFTEWHSDVYYQKTADALITFVEFANDPARVERATIQGPWKNMVMWRAQCSVSITSTAARNSSMLRTKRS